jgi:hypothetical protein
LEFCQDLDWTGPRPKNSKIKNDLAPFQNNRYRLHKRGFMKILCFLIFIFSLKIFAAANISDTACDFSPAGYGIHFNVDDKGEVQNILTKDLINHSKDSTSQTRHFTTEKNGISTIDYIKTTNPKDDDTYHIYIGTKNTDAKKKQLANSQNMAIQEYDAAIKINNGRCELMTMTGKDITTNQKILIYDYILCAALINKWTETLNTKSGSTCVDSMKELNDWYSKKNTFFNSQGLSLYENGKTTSDLNAVQNKVTACQLRGDPSIQLNKERAKPTEKSVIERIKDAITPDAKALERMRKSRSTR